MDELDTIDDMRKLAKDRMKAKKKNKEKKKKEKKKEVEAAALDKTLEEDKEITE
jgi:hypothetical protein